MLRKIITVLTIIMASPAATQELQSIDLQDGTNAYQSKAIAPAMSDKILEAFKYYVEESYYIYGRSYADKTI